MTDLIHDPVELSSNAVNWLNEYTRLLAEKKVLEEKIDIARGFIEAEIGESELGLVNGQPAIKWSFVTSNRFDQAKAKALLTEEQIASCTVLQKSRRFVPVSDITE